MEDKYVQTLENLERRIQENIVMYSPVLMERLDDIALSMIHEHMTDNDYLKLLQMYAFKYERLQNKKGLRFCLLRMQQIQYVKENPRERKAFRRIHFTKHVNEKVEAYLSRFPNYYLFYRERFVRRVLLWDVIVSVAIMMLLVWGMKMSFFVGWMISIFLFVALFVWTQSSIFPRMMNDRLTKLRYRIDDSCAAVDTSICG